MIRIFKFTQDRRLLFSEQIDYDLLNLSAGEMLWVDLEASNPEENRILSDWFKFHPLAIEDCIGDVQYPKLDIYDGYIFLVVHGINWLTKTGQFETAEVDVFLGKNFLVTHHRHQMRSILLATTRCKTDVQFFANSIDTLLHLILDKMVDNYFPELEKLEDKIEGVENDIFAQPSRETLEKILHTKREVLHLKRIVSPQREVFNRLSRDEIPYVRPATRLYFRDIYDNLFRMSDIADSYRDMLSSLLDAYLSSISNSLNNIMKILTMITVIFLPLSVGTSMYGMNFEKMPGLKSPHGFFIALACMIVFSLSMFVFFRFKKWL